MLASPGFNIDWQITKLELARSGDLAYTLYIYKMSMQGPDGKPIANHGKDMAVWKKQQDGTWKSWPTLLIRMWLQRHRRTRTGYARQTITKVCRSEDVQTAIRETKAILLGESDAWAESINYAVTHETDGKLAYQLAKDFGVIPIYHPAGARK